MNCHECTDLITEYECGDLTVELRERVERHLHVCPYCVLMIEEYRATIRVTRALPKCEAALPEGFEARLRRMLG